MQRIELDWLEKMAQNPIILKVIDEESVAVSKSSGCTGYLYLGIKPKLGKTILMRRTVHLKS